VIALAMITPEMKTWKREESAIRLQVFGTLPIAASYARRCQAVPADA
jgi:hypothetical protein